MKELELYIHIPFCVRKCKYCDFLSFDNHPEMESAYVDALLKQLDFYGDLYSDRLISSIYIGGGTPSAISSESISKICGRILKKFVVDIDAEVTMEANPGTITSEKATAYKMAGINRISMGLQSANDDELLILGRIHTWDDFLRSYEKVLKAGITNTNIDIMTALPFQTEEKLSNTLKKVLMFRPNHISAYSLILEEGTPLFEEHWQDLAKRKHGRPTTSLPDEETEYALGELARNTLADAGYVQYEISNYAKPGFECRHNVGYWKRAEYIGIGIGAASLVNGTRFNVTSDILEYIRKMDEGDFNGALTDVQVLSKKDKMSEFMFLGLRMLEGVSVFEFQKEFATTIDKEFGYAVAKLKKQGLLIEDKGFYKLTQRGLDLANVAMSEFV